MTHLSNWFIDCSLAARADRITGIPRVIRELVAAGTENLGQASRTVLRPVGVSGGSYRGCEIQRPQPARGAFARRLVTAAHQRADAFLRNHAPGLQRSLVAALIGLGGVPSWALARSGAGTSEAPLRFNEGDVLVLADATWVIPQWRAAVSTARADGARIVPVIYDLLPADHSEFFSKLFCAQFERWLKDMLPLSDAFVCISHATADALRAFAARHGQSGSLAPIGVFPLGATIPAADEAHGSSVADIFQGDNPRFLMVGTLEPRKNHGQVLDAFEMAWKRGSKAQLVIIGRRGWQCDTVVARITKLKRAGCRLAHLDSATDADLRHAYQRARCLIFPSFAEGFGLPIIEALAQGLPVLASDIPVHREVGGRLAEFFPLGDSRRLAAIIEGIEDGSFPLTRPEPGSVHLPSWQESAAALACEIRKLLGDTPEESSPPDHAPS